MTSRHEHDDETLDTKKILVDMMGTSHD